MNAFIALVRKDLRLHFSNRRAVIMNFVAPILIAAFFGSLFGTGGARPAKVPLAVVDLDHSETSQRLVAAMRADASFTISDAPPEAIPALVNNGELRAAVTLPAGFGEQAQRALMAGFGAAPAAADKPRVELRYDPSQATTLPMVRGLVMQHAVAAVTAGMPGGRAFSAPFTVSEVQAATQTATPYNGYAHSFAGMGVQFILMMGVEMGVGLLLMRRLGLWKRLRAAPLSRATLLGSRLASCAVIAVVVFVVIYAVAIAVFDVRIAGSVPGFLAVIGAFALLTASFGLLVAAFGRTPEATRGLAILVTLLMVMLGGAWVPSFIFPEWLQRVAMFVPTRWAVDGLDAMTWRALPFSAAVLPVAVMLAFSAAFAALAVWRFDWEE